MKNLRKSLVLLAAFLAVYCAPHIPPFVGNVASAQVVTVPLITPSGNSDVSGYNGYLANEPGLAYTKNYALDLSKYMGSRISAEVIYGTTTLNAATVNILDGAQSTGSFTVLSYAALSSASATNQLTVISTSGLNGAVITIGNNTLTYGQQWSQGQTVNATAKNLAAAISLLPNLSANVAATGGIVYATATFGSFANSWGTVSNNSSVTVANSVFTGGQDNAVVTINGTKLTQGSGAQWNAVTSNAQTATNLAAAINTAFPGKLSAIGSGSVVYATSTLNGTQFNYSLLSSTPTALQASGVLMVSGSNPGMTLGSSLFTSTAAGGFTLAQDILYPVSANPNIGGLVQGTTYFAVPAGNFKFYLAKYSTSAVAGYTPDYALVTSTNTQLITSQHTYALAPLAIVGNSTYTWQASNDNINWATTLTTGTVTITSYPNTAGPNGPNISLFDFGAFNFRYLRLNFQGPAAGGLFLQVPVSIKQDGIGRF